MLKFNQLVKPFRFVIVLGLLVLKQNCFALDFKGGIIFMRNGDTVYADLRPQAFNRFYALDVKVEDEIRALSSINVLAYQWGNRFFEGLYIPAGIAGSVDTIFIERLKQGQINLYRGYYRWDGCGCSKTFDGKTTSVARFIKINSKDYPAILQIGSLGKLKNVLTVQSYLQTEFRVDVESIKTLRKLKTLIKALPISPSTDTNL